MDTHGHDKEGTVHRGRRMELPGGLALMAGMLGGLSFVLFAGLALAQSPGAQGPPQFLTVPIRSRMIPAGLVNGHVVYVPPVAVDHMGGPAVKPGGGGGHGGQSGGQGGSTTDFGQPGGVNVTSTCFADSATNFDATCAQDSYQGEPMAVGAGSLLIGAENDIYPGACSACAVPGTFGDCGLSATRSSTGESWTRSKLSRSWGGHDFLLGFDPSAAIDSQGRVFACFGVADGGGVIHVTYLDRRDDAADCRTNTYMSSSLAGGASFSDVKITDVDSSFDGNPNGPGDYGSVTAVGSEVYPYFADHRDANAAVDSVGATLDGGFEIYAAHRP
jgi:hypothetical protein